METTHIAPVHRKLFARRHGLSVLLTPVCLSLLACGSGIRASSVPSAPSPSPPKQSVIVFIGDSITQLWGNQSAFMAKSNWINKGIWGETSTQIALRFQKDVIDLHPDVVQIIAGTNDVNAGWQLCKSDASGLATATTPPEGQALTAIPETCSNLLYMVETARRNNMRVFLGSIPPWGCSDKDCGQEKVDDSKERYDRIAQLNAWIKDFAGKEGATFVDYHAVLAEEKGLYYRAGFSDDGIHPNDAGYAAMQEAAVAALP